MKDGDLIGWSKTISEDAVRVFDAAKLSEEYTLTPISGLRGENIASLHEEHPWANNVSIDDCKFECLRCITPSH
ncbi:hypothetical protein S40293_10364 [Stachybotrys chartarum IBT 40293]|nr:hypothetical protein S40293_10364 [Stachybotrys chartarum IBT 40293]